MSVSVVIPNLNSPILDRVVAALRKQTVPPQEIIVVGQDRYNLVQADGIVQLLNTPQRVSAARARNLGARQAVGEYLLFVDADCIASPTLVECMLARRAGDARVVGGGVQWPRQNYWTLCDNLLSFAPFHVSAPAGTRPYLPSLNLSIERQLFLRLGGFDESYPGAAGEDTEFSLRLRTYGHVLHFEPGAHVTHQPERATARAVWRHLRAFGRAHYRTQQRHPMLSTLPVLKLNAGWAWLIFAMAPLLACWDTAKLSFQQALLRSPLAAPGLIWGKLAWYWGLAEALAIAKPFEKDEGGRRKAEASGKTGPSSSFILHISSFLQG